MAYISIPPSRHPWLYSSCGIHKLQCFQMKYQSVFKMFDQASVSKCLPLAQETESISALKSWVQFRLCCWGWKLELVRLTLTTCFRCIMVWAFLLKWPQHHSLGGGTDPPSHRGMMTQVRSWASLRHLNITWWLQVKLWDSFLQLQGFMKTKNSGLCLTQRLAISDIKTKYESLFPRAV